MKTKIILQGQNLTPDCVNILRAILVNEIIYETGMTKHPRPIDLENPHYLTRARIMHLLNAVDGRTYVRVGEESQKFSIFIGGRLLDDADATIIISALTQFGKGSVFPQVMEYLTGFSSKHFGNLLEVMAVPLDGLIQRDTEEDEPIPYD